MAEMGEYLTASSVPRPRSWQWPLAVFGLLGFQLCVCGVGLYFATSDPSVAIEPRYYEKALAWDDEAAQRATNTRLGWVASLAVSDDADAAGRRNLRLALTTNDARPLDGAKVKLVAFHHTRSSDRLVAELAPESDGFYAAWLPLRQSGWWEVRVRIERGPEVFTQIEPIDIRPAKAGTGG